MRVTVFDYGAGNLHSLCKALLQPGIQVTLETNAARALDGDLLVLPGVGAFGPAAARLAPARADIRDALLDGKPAIGICLGMQLLFDRSEEAEGEGLGLIAGEVTRLRASRVPHIGWNRIVTRRSLADARDDTVPTVYFANGYACRPRNVSVVRAWCRHVEDQFPAIVRVSRTIGVQFHPEKSGDAGVALLSSLVREVTCS
jgi:glutamine amidotransferase